MPVNGHPSSSPSVGTVVTSRLSVRADLLSTNPAGLRAADGGGDVLAVCPSSIPDSLADCPDPGKAWLYPGRLGTVTTAFDCIATNSPILRFTA